MNFIKITGANIDGNQAVAISINGVRHWAAISGAGEYANLWNIAERSAVTDWLEVEYDGEKELSEDVYYVGAWYDSTVYAENVSNVSVSADSVTFTTLYVGCGIGIAFQLDPGASYTFAAKSNTNAQIAMCVCDDVGVYVDESDTTTPAGTSHSLTFDAPTDSGYWVFLSLCGAMSNSTVTFTDITLLKN